MDKKHIKRLPVVEDGKPVGVISRSDLLRVLALKLAQIAAGEYSDVAICADINSSMASESWMPKTGIRIAVKDAVVNLEGVIMSDSDRQAVNVIAENAVGVVGVTDHMVFVDPGSGMAFP